MARISHLEVQANERRVALQRARQRHHVVVLEAMVLYTAVSGSPSMHARYPLRARRTPKSATQHSLRLSDCKVALNSCGSIR